MVNNPLKYKDPTGLYQIVTTMDADGNIIQYEVPDDTPVTPGPNTIVSPSIKVEVPPPPTTPPAPPMPVQSPQNGAPPGSSQPQPGGPGPQVGPPAAPTAISSGVNDPAGSSPAAPQTSGASTATAVGGDRGSLSGWERAGHIVAGVLLLPTALMAMATGGVMFTVGSGEVVGSGLGFVVGGPLTGLAMLAHGGLMAGAGAALVGVGVGLGLLGIGLISSGVTGRGFSFPGLSRR